MMDLIQLEVFLSVAETKSFSETGRIVHRAQSSVTRTIKQLEMELGTSLFHRTTHAVELTRAGRALVPYAKEMLNLQEKLIRSISIIEKKVSGPLKIGASLTIADAVLPHLLEEFISLYPQVKFKVTIDTSHNVMQALQNRGIHFALTEAEIPANDSISVKPFKEDELVVIVRPDHPAAQKKSISLAELSKLPLVMREKGSGMRAFTERMFSQEGISFDDLDIVMELNSTETIKKMTANGLGAAIISKSCLNRELELKLLKPLSIKPTPLKRNFYYAYREEGSLYPSIEALQDILLDLYGGKNRIMDEE
ncbi:selenium metabolism-associated LysR family transcriptional regulator [Bacillus marinisedimentorum]|uniref:selenium metabolism-associated LysR family transcriptional regulator n=1 Tax=Bacillus marinisedimentorum TaxID=1821260 RepID=UPI000871D08D|nr:selenium metabolism-associated LysR family transcriptional regulator [Bacillus marinisedimentorum]